MKKLMFATALVASAAAFADPATLQAGSQESMSGPLNAISFEGYDANDTFLNGATEKDEGGNDKTDGPFFYFQGDQNGSMVKAFGGENVAAPDIMRPLYFASQELTNNKYLELSTEGGILWRSINQISAEGENPVVYGLGNPQPIAETGTYLDTLMQFTPSEDGNVPDYDESNDKLVIWLNIDSSGAAPVTNLMVRAAYYDSYGTPNPTNFVLTGKTVESGEWYRLTIKAVPNIIDQEGTYASFYNIPAFIIYVDGTEMAAVEAPVGSSLAELDGAIDSDFSSLVAAKKVFPSLIPGSSEAPTLQGVGFKGSGALDDIVWTEEDPFPAPATFDFTLTWPSGLTAVGYTLGTGGAIIPVTGSSPATINGVADGSLVTFIVANADGAQKAITVTASSSVNSIDATGTTFGWPEYLGEALAGGEYGIDSAAELLLFKKGVEAGLSTTNETFKLTANIDATSVSPWDGIGTYNSSVNAFVGTLDGAGFAISNLTFAVEKYRGFFDQLEGTVKNLTINVASFADTSAAEHGYAAFAGNTKNATFINCVASGVIGTTAKPAMHTCGGFVVKVSSNTSFTACTNHINIVCALTDNPKIGGIVGLAQGAALTNCWNDGNMTITVAKCDNDGNGAGGLLGLTQTSANTISGGGNAGIIQSGTDNPSGTKAIRLGSLVASPASVVAVSGGTVAQADMKPAGANFDKVTGASYATVAGNVATFVADTALAAGNTYKLMTPSLTPTYTFAAPGTIAFDEALNAPTAYAITASAALGIPTSSTSADVTTWTVGYFPRTATAGQTGAAANPFEIADVDDLQALQAAVDADVSYRSLSYKQTANIDMSSAGAFLGIGTYDETSPMNGKSFSGIYDGQGYKIENITMTARTYGGVFNQVGGGTVKNLAVENVSLVADATKGGFAIVGNFGGNGALLQNLTASGSFGSSAKPGFHNMAGIVVRACGGGANGALVKDCTNNAAIYGTYTKLGGICTITQHKIDGAAITFDGCVNTGTLTMPSGSTAGRDGLAGIVGYVSEKTALQNCVNTGTMSSTLSSAKIGELIGWAQGSSLTDLGDNTAAATSPMIGAFSFTYQYVTNSTSPLNITTNRTGLTCSTTGFQFSTVADGKATTTINALANGGEYLLQREVWESETPFTFQAAGTIAFDTKFYPFNGTIGAAEGLTVTDSTSGTVKTYTAAAAGGGYPTYLTDAPAEVKAAYDTWKVANGADTNSEYENQFLVNAAPATVVPATALAITAIEQNETAGWDITVECSVQGVDLGGTVGTARVGNGYLAVSYTDNLTGTWTTENIAITASANGKVTVNVNKSNAKFMKVKLSPVQEPQN